jgi:uncharacterized protein with HEPN domain
LKQQRQKKIFNSLLWSIIQDDVPELLPLLKALKDETQS